MANNSAERGSTGGLATILMIVAVLLSAGLLVWLSFASRPEPEPEMAMEGDGMEMTSGSMAQTVTAAEFGANIASWVGQEINLTGVTVSTVVNDQIIWVDVPTAQGNTPFTVRLLPGAVAATPAAQSRIDVEGRVLVKSDSVLNAWQQSGAIANANVRATLEFGQNFIEATMVRPSAGMD